MTVTMSGRDCLPPYAVIDSWHRLGNLTGPRCYVQFAVKKQNQCCLFSPSGNVKKKSISVGLGVKISFVAFRQLYKL